MRIRILVIAILMSFLTIGVTPYWVNSYSGETGVGIIAGGLAGCMMNEAYQELKKPTPPPQPTMQNTSKHECRQLCDDRYPRSNQHEYFIQCLESCR